MPNIYKTNQKYVEHIDCNPQKQKQIIFEGSFLKVVMGSEVLDSTDLSTLFHPASENGGSFVKRFYISPGANYTLYGGNISQDQGEVSMIIIRITYDPSLTEDQQLITLEYEGKIFPCNNLFFVTGKTLDTIKYHGWDLEPWNDQAESPQFSPVISHMPTSPDLNFGGILINNPTTQEIEVEILVMN